MKKMQIMLLLILVFFLFGCSSNKLPNDGEDTHQTPALSKELEKALVNPSVSKFTKKIIEDFRDKKVPQSSIEKIYAKLAKREITMEEATVLSITSAFAPQKLSAQFKKDDNSLEHIDLDSQIKWLNQNYEKLSKENKEKVRPFIVSPDHPESIFHPQNKKRSIDILGLLFPPIIAQAESFAPLRYNTMHSDGAVIIKYHNVALTDEQNILLQKKAELVLEAITKAWPMLQSLLEKEPQFPIVVHIVPLPQGLYGEASWEISAEKCWITLSNSIDDQLLKSTAVHELFHAFQYGFSPTYQKNEMTTDWLCEATATWSSHYVYPDYNVEHRYLERFFSTLDQNRIQFGGGFEYASHMLIYFLTQYSNQPKIVRTLLDVCSSGDVYKMFPYGIPNFSKTYSEFALYNWDRDPFMAYQDVPSFPHLGANGPCLDVLIHEERKETPYEISLMPGACLYKYHDFVGPDIKMVTFQLDGLITDKYLRLQALININDVWTREDWTEIKSKKFCKNRPEENVKTVILVFSNANLTDMAFSKYAVDTKGECVEASGYTKVTASYSDGPYKMKLFYHSADDIEYDKDRKYVDDEGNSDYDQPDYYIIKNRVTKFDYLSTGKFGSHTGTGALNETYDKKGAPIKIEVYPALKEGKLFLNPEKTNKQWVTYTINSPFGTDTQKKDIESLGFLNGIDLEPADFTKDSIQGKRSFSTMFPNGEVPVECTLEFKYPFRKSNNPKKY